jgi:hypothetical protein
MTCSSAGAGPAPSAQVSSSPSNTHCMFITMQASPPLARAGAQASSHSNASVGNSPMSCAPLSCNRRTSSRWITVGLGFSTHAPGQTARTVRQAGGGKERAIAAAVCAGLLALCPVGPERWSAAALRGRESMRFGIAAAGCAGCGEVSADDDDRNHDLLKKRHRIRMRCSHAGATLGGQEPGRLDFGGVFLGSLPPVGSGQHASRVATRAPALDNRHSGTAGRTTRSRSAPAVP